MAEPTAAPTGATSGSAAVAYNLENADKIDGMPKTGHEAITTESGGVGEANHPDPALFGVMNGTVWVSLAMAVLLLVFILKRVPAMIARGLDSQIADIRRQLDEAKALRAEAEGLRDDYARRIAAAEGDAATMREHAEQEAALVIAKAREGATELVERRRVMAEDRIAAAERAALAEVRARTADAAARAAATLLGNRLDAAVDRPLVDRTIAGLGRLN